MTNVCSFRNTLPDYNDDEVFFYTYDVINISRDNFKFNQESNPGPPALYAIHIKVSKQLKIFLLKF